MFRTNATRHPFRLARAIPLLLAIGFAVLSLACSSGELPFMGSCLHMSEGKVTSCYEFYGEAYGNAAKSQCEYFHKPELGRTTKVLDGKCPAEGRTGVSVNEWEDEEVRMDQVSYAD